jgi:putative DNA primase/helicase
MTVTTATSPLEGARQLVARGNSVVCVPPDGSKHPRGGWKDYQQRRPTDPQLVAWFGQGHNGPAVVAGKVSGGREVVDVDRAALFDPWCEAVERRCPGLLDRLPVVATPRPGFQVHYRCPVVEGNQPLAREAKTPTPEDPAPFVTVIETRGEGGLALTPYCPPGCHPRRRRYELVRGDFDDPPVLSPEERAALLDAGRAFNTYLAPAVVTGTRPRTGGAVPGDRPGDRFNARTTWGELLEPRGWRALFRSGETVIWRRPGKHAGGGSATTNYGDSDLLYVFSSNAAPFQPLTSYTKFAVFAFLEHQGDFSAAARALVEREAAAQGPGWGRVVRGPDGLRGRLFVPLREAP